METVELMQTPEGYNQVITRNVIQIAIFAVVMVLGAIIGGYIGAALLGAGLGGTLLSLVYLVAALARKSKASKIQQAVVRLSPEGLGFLIPASEHSFQLTSDIKTIPWSNVKSVGGAKQGFMEALAIDLVRPEEFMPALSPKEQKKLANFVRNSKADIKVPIKTTGLSAEEISQTIEQYWAAQ